MNRRATKAVCAAAAGVLGLGTSAVVLAAIGSPSGAHVGFMAPGPAGLKIEGATSAIQVTDDGTTLTIEVPLADLSTGIALRDHHMREKYLEVPKFPSAKLQVARGALKFPAAGAGAESDVAATLALHGQTRPVTVHYDAKGDGAGFSVRGHFHVNMNDYGITVPTYLGVTVKPDVDVSATFHVAGS